MTDRSTKQVTVSGSFVADVRSAVGMWRGALLVPAIYALLTVVSVVAVLRVQQPPTHCETRHLGVCPAHANASLAALSILSVPFSLFHVGLSGTARVWYARRRTGDSMSPGEVWTLSWRFFGRFFVLGLLVALIAAPFVIGGLIAAVVMNNATPLVATSVTVTIIADFALTFATPWLALFDPRPAKAIPAGLRLLRAAWPRCLPYALVPPLALQVIAQTLQSYTNHWVLAAFALLGPLLTLAFAGATVLFLLRHYPDPPFNGSLDVPEPTK